MNILIVGGTSGLGLEIGTQFSNAGNEVYVTGRSPERVPKELSFLRLDITSDAARLSTDVARLLVEAPAVGLLVYAAGFYEQGRIDELSEGHLLQMINVGFTAPALIMEKLMQKQKTLGGVIAITSTSQWIPREREPVYAATKAGLAMFAQSLSLDERIEKTLVVGPSGMNTAFWEGTGRTTHDLMQAPSVASRVMELWSDSYTFRLARILREPERVQILETRQ